MDRNFYQQKLAQEHQREISQELATRNLLKEADPNASSTKGGAWIAERVVLVALTIAVLILLDFLH